MGNEFLREVDVNTTKDKKPKRTCCVTGIHNPENGRCIQSMKPFKDEIAFLDRKRESKLVREVLKNRDFRMEDANSELEDDVDLIVSSFSRIFDINDY